MTLPHDYLERVYAGVLGKIIGVYLGRPFEGWTYERIMKTLGEVWYYVADRLGKPLVVTDDDISGTFTFLRALPDHGNDPALTPRQIGETWLNYLIDRRTILWWGGLGNSTEHTAYLRLKAGIPAPESGSIARNGKVVAEQIGAQIFIDGWAMVCPGDPERAADFARRAGSVSHDGEALYGAMVLAAMEALAFVEPSLDRLLDESVRLIPADSVIYRLIADLRNWRAQESNWHAAFRRIEACYGYDQYGGNCHIVPNHALIHLGLLYGEDDFQKTLMITNTAGWDTDCNSGNVGCLMGIKNGLAGIEAGPDWRSPLADRLYLPTADGGRCITDAAREAVFIANSGRALQGLEPLAPKGGARFHFALPGAMQGFQVEEGNLRLENTALPSQPGSRALALHYNSVAEGCPARAATPTFVPPELASMGGYELYASPTLYPGQTVRARLAASPTNSSAIAFALYLAHYGAGDRLERVYAPAAMLAPGAADEFTWQVPDLGSDPIAAVGIEIRSSWRASGTLYLDYLTWDGAPRVTFTRPAHDGTLWRRAWVNGVDQTDARAEPFRLMQNAGRGLLIQGTGEWTDYRVCADVTPHMSAAAGLAGRVQGMRRYYALLLVQPGKVRLVKALESERTLAEADFPWQFGETHVLALRFTGKRIEASLDGQALFAFTDEDNPLLGGAVALVCEEGRTATQRVKISPE